MIKWHAVSFGRSTISPVEIVKETDRFVTLKNGTRAAKTCIRQYRVEGFFDTWHDAQAFLLAHLTTRVQQCRIQLQNAYGALGNVSGMKPPPGLV